MGLIDSIKSNVAKSGSNKEKILYVKADSKVRIRFLQELDTGYEFVFHDSFDKGINTICQEELGKNCPLCGDDELRTRTLYAWSVYNYDTKRVEVMLYAVNNCTPVAGLVSMYENYGTILDRDYVLSKQGKQQNTTFTVIPQDKQKFRNEKAKPYTKSALLKILTKAYPISSDLIKEDDDEEFDVDELDLDDEDEEEEEVTPKKKSKKTKKIEPEDDEDEEIEYARISDEEVEEAFNGGKKTSKNKKKEKKEKSKPKKEKKLTEEEMSDMLEEEDIDEDDFLEYHDEESLEDISKTKKQFQAMIDEYLEDEDEE